MLKPIQVTALKFAGVAIAGYWIYSNVQAAKNAATEVVTTKLNPMHKDNLAHITAQKIIGPDELQSGFTRIFDAIDWAAEAVGSETGINGIPGTNADQAEKMARLAGNAATVKFGVNSNG
jgi:hypothetical protein